MGKPWGPIYKSPVASSVPFGPACDLESDNVEDAICEVKAIATDVIGGLWQHVFNRNSTVKNKWLNNQEVNIPSNNSPHCVVWKSKLVGLSFTNKYAGVNCDIKLYITAEGDGNSPKVKLYEWQIRNCRTKRKTNFNPDVIIEAGDKLAIFCSEQGKKPNDLVIVTYWQIIETNSQEYCENWSGDFELSHGGATTTI